MKKVVYESLVCPFCLGHLYSKDAGLVCERCLKEYSFLYGMPILSANQDFYYGELKKSVFRKLLLDAQKEGTTRAVTRAINEGNMKDFALNYAYNPHRASFLLLLTPSKDKIAVDLGCGWGRTSLTLARAFDKVYSLDLTKERVAFLAMRAVEEGLDNIIPLCAGDTPHLPFSDKSVDCVVINGVLEWVPEGKEGDPRELQLKYLLEINRILRDNGLIYIGIENRLAHTYLRGQLEDHTGMKYTSLLPRCLADMVSKRIRNKPYRTYTYTILGYKKLLTQAGFRVTRFFYPYPTYRDMNSIREFEPSGIMKELLRPKLEETKLRALKLLATPIVNHSFSIVAGKAALGPVLCEQIVERVVARLGWQIPTKRILRKNLFATSHSGYAITIESSEEGVFVKVPLDLLSYNNCKADFNNLKFVRAMLKEDESEDLVPRPLFSDEISGIDFFVQELVKSLNQGAFRKNKKKKRKIENIRLLKLLADKSFVSNEIDSRFSWEQLELAIDLTGIMCPDVEKLRENLQNILQMAGSLRVPTHGDLWLGNIIDDGQEYKVIDWADYTHIGLPLYDFWHLSLYQQACKEAKSRNSSAWDILLNWGKYSFPADLSDLIFKLQETLCDYGKDQSWEPKRVSSLFFLYIFENVTRRITRAPWRASYYSNCLQGIVDWLYTGRGILNGVSLLLKV